MTDKREINVASKAAFADGKYQLAFETLLTAGANHFIAYAERESTKENKINWLSDSDSADFFWKVFILRNDVFSDLVTSQSADQLLFNYFTYYRKSIPELELKLATEVPITFVRSIRTNQVFLRPDRIENICLVPLNADFRIHQKVWRNLFVTENNLWNEVEVALKETSNHSLSDILSCSVTWLEVVRFKSDSQEFIHHLSAVYSLFIELVLMRFPEKIENINSSETFSSHFFNFFRTISNDEVVLQENPVVILLTSISNWINFKNTQIDPYSFDLKIEPIQQDELVIFNSTPVNHYRWIVNGVRYAVNHLSYVFQGMDVTEHLEREQLIVIPGKNVEDVELNRKLAASKYATLLLLEDMVCRTFKYGKSESNPEDLLAPLFEYSFNKLIRYEYPLRSLSGESTDWFMSYKKLVLNNLHSGNIQEPFFMMSRVEYKTLNQKALSGLPENITEEIITFFSLKLDSNNRFNRFKKRYNVFETPFIRIGDFLFCPMLFFANNGWFYSFAQMALSGKGSGRVETIEMEQHLGNLFQNKGWRVKVTNDKEANIIDGDIDIFIEDDHDLLLVQLKRSYFRLDLKDAYFESINSDRKAINQIVRAERYLLNENPIYSVQKPVIKWVVSTSFENVGVLENGCEKVNYFELLRALENQEITNIKDLSVYIQSDQQIGSFISLAFNSDLSSEVREMFHECVKPLAVFDSRKYKQILYSEDLIKTSHYNNLFDRALDLGNANKPEEALLLFQKCIALNPNDGEAFSAAANILADLRRFDEAFFMYSKALKFLPNDPSIARNYSLALLEAGKWYEGLELAWEILENYPLLVEMKLIFTRNFERCVSEGFLMPNEITKLSLKLNGLSN
ncbi:tetratricopeptide repeat protein [Lacibacter sediminis]|uniref:Tetratricopeptide repeat protein n=1 Tax=Lacibacter sediminis TaxID=2760713 RepID=A0A7G5XFN2_9BACT|nr:hypothetical protein [Lacibacter sediminis]QNA44285.1 hypothetical protein H4075_19815 [Lacibacter sediminis]